MQTNDFILSVIVNYINTNHNNIILTKYNEKKNKNDNLKKLYKCDKSCGS